MRRGQTRRVDDGSTKFTKRELMAASGLSAKTFDTIRKAARVRGPGHGGLDWEFSVEAVRALIHRAASGTFSERGGSAVEGWTKLLEGAGEDAGGER